jgi:hypothetical protein
VANEVIIEILRKQQASKNKTVAVPSRRNEAEGRRRGGVSLRFYDLAQVNHQALDAEPVWEDHPILETPSYTDITDSGIAKIYAVDRLSEAGWQNYTDMMFNYPVTEWTQRYRLVAGNADDTASSDFGFDARISLNDSGDYPDVGESGTEVLGNQRVLSSNPTYAASRAAKLAAHGWAWTPKNVEYRGLERLDICTALQSGYFGMSTGDKTNYKVTATNDPDAADVGVLVPQGNVNVFLMPQIILFIATSHEIAAPLGPGRTEVLGPWYQVTPRHLWPRYGDGFVDGFPYGADADKNAFIEYQQAREGAQASWWEFPEDPITSIDPVDWSKGAAWGCSTIAGDTSSSGGYFSGQWRGQTLFGTTTAFQEPETHLFFVNTEPFLTGVIGMGGQYYYVWDISTPSGLDQNYSAQQTSANLRRFEIDVDVNWDPEFVDPNPPKPKDGTGTDHDEFS